MHNWRTNIEALIFIILKVTGVKCVTNVFIRQHIIIVFKNIWLILVLNKANTSVHLYRMHSDARRGKSTLTECSVMLMLTSTPLFESPIMKCYGLTLKCICKLTFLMTYQDRLHYLHLKCNCIFLLTWHSLYCIKYPDSKYKCQMFLFPIDMRFKIKVKSASLHSLVIFCIKHFVLCNREVVLPVANNSWNNNNKKSVSYLKDFFF